ncbi:glycoside hydrolase superfamily [Sporodiniella umbellata]|nr:glycoside hydrolase superfamily [Sporodiniella umbellata]
MQFTLFFTFLLSFSSWVNAIPIQSRAAGSIYGVTYTARNANGGCLSAGQVASAVKEMKSKGITHVRTYSQECDQLPSLLKAIQANGGGMTVLAAVWIQGNANDDHEISTLKSVLSQNHGNQYIGGILVGNEVLFNNYLSESVLIQKIAQVKAFAGKYRVSTADIPPSYTSRLTNAVDFVAANIYPFFSDVTVNEAMNNLNAQYNRLKNTVGGKDLWITETGWPSAGNAMGKAVPSKANAQTYVSGLEKSSLPYYYFEWQDSQWKSTLSEKSFGLLDSAGKIKYTL